jgi:hypothetical protein
MALFKGHLRQIRGIPERAEIGDIGLDAKGRKVFTFATTRRKKGTVVSARWLAYDLAQNRTHPIGGLPAKCLVTWATLWRGSMAYTTSCKRERDSGLFVRQGKRTQRLPIEPSGYALRFRAGTLAVIFDTGLDDFVVYQRMANGKECQKQIDPSYGDATSEYGWAPSGLWNTGDALIWTMGSWRVRRDFVILTAKVLPGCRTPGPIGTLPFTPETATVDALAVDGRRVFYADDDAVRRHILPAEPSFDPPANDDFEHAQQLSGGPSFYATGRVAYATVQPGEPLADAKHTVWYAYRPEQSGTFYVNGPTGRFRYGVYTGTSPGTLVPIPPPSDPYQTYTRVDGVAGETYWIAVGSPSPEPNHEPFVVTVTPNPPF